MSDSNAENPAHGGKTVSTDPDHRDDELAGRTYAIPFDRVWNAALRVAESRGWSVTETDDTAGTIVAEAKSPFLGRVDDIRVRVRLDENGQTRVDMTSGLRGGRFDLGRNRRRIRRLVRGLDAALDTGERTILRSSVPPTGAGLALLVILSSVAGCEPRAPVQQAGATDSDTVAAEPVSTLERAYERALMFQATDVDSALAVTWLFEHDARTDRVDRLARGWLLRQGTWDPFFDTLDVSPPSEDPWRLLPAGPMRLIVGERDQIDRIVFDDGTRLLDFRIEDPGPEWTGRRGGTFRLLGGAIVLGDRRVDGRILDVSRALRPGQGSPGDWVFLISGDSITVVLQAPLQSREPGGFQGWALRGDQEYRWPDVTLDWAEARPFDRARRDVPVAWTIRSAEGELEGVLEVRSTALEAGVGEGPLLPVDGLFEVSGTLVIDGRERTVHGLIRHQQGRRIQ